MTLSTFNVVRLFFLLHSYIRTYLVLFIHATLNLQRKKNLNEVFREKFCVAWHLGAKLAGGFRDSVKGVRGRDMI